MWLEGCDQGVAGTLCHGMLYIDVGRSGKEVPSDVAQEGLEIRSVRCCANSSDVLWTMLSIKGIRYIRLYVTIRLWPRRRRHLISRDDITGQWFC